MADSPALPFPPFHGSPLGPRPDSGCCDATSSLRTALVSGLKTEVFSQGTRVTSGVLACPHSAPDAPQSDPPQRQQ